MHRGGLHTTTVRFPHDTWTDLKDACETAGIPVAQYIREATVSRLSRGGRLSDTTALVEQLAEVDARLRYVERGLHVALAVLRAARHR